MLNNYKGSSGDRKPTNALPIQTPQELLAKLPEQAGAGEIKFLREVNVGGRRAAVFYMDFSDPKAINPNLNRYISLIKQSREWLVCPIIKLQSQLSLDAIKAVSANLMQATMISGPKLLIIDQNKPTNFVMDMLLRTFKNGDIHVENDQSEEQALKKMLEILTGQES